jgi:hypothetical protein
VGPVPKRRLRRTVGISAAVLVGAFVALCALGLVVERFDRSPDDRLAARATIGASRLPADWSTHEGEGTKGDGALDAHICGNAAGTLPDHTGSYDRQFGYRLGHGLEYAHLDVGVLISPTAADAEREFVAAREAGPTYRSCVMARAIELSRYGSPQETGQPVATFSRLRDHRVVGVVDQIQVTTPTVVGPRVTFVAFVRMQIDRAIVRMPVTTWGRPMALDDLLPIIEAERHQVVSALSG